MNEATSQWLLSLLQRIDRTLTARPTPAALPPLNGSAHSPSYALASTGWIRETWIPVPGFSQVIMQADATRDGFWITAPGAGFILTTDHAMAQSNQGIMIGTDPFNINVHEHGCMPKWQWWVTGNGNVHLLEYGQTAPPRVALGR